MRVLITGGAGFIGSHTSDLLLERGYEVRILDNLQHRVHPRGKPSYVPKDAEFVLGDVRRRKDLEKALKGVDYVFHLAAYQDYMLDFSTFFHVNTVSTALLFELIVMNRFSVRKIVLASSQAVYGEGKYQCEKHGVIYPSSRPLEQLKRGQWELKCPKCGEEIKPLKIDETRVNPHTAYGVSKYASEMAAYNLGRKYEIPAVNLRYSIVQGPRNSFYNAYSGICRIFTLLLLRDLAPVVYEDGRQLRDYVYIGDVTRANLLVMEKDEANYQTFNVGGRKGTTVLEFAKILADKCGKNIEPGIPGEFRFGDTRHTVSDSSKLQSLGWEPATPLERIVEEYVEWVKTQPEIKDYYSEAEKIMKRMGIVQTST